MGIFTYLIAIAVGIFAQKTRGRNGLAWGAGTLAIISVGHVYIQLAGGSEWLWTIIVSIASMLLLVGLKPGSNTVSGTVECPFCAEKISVKAKLCKYCGKDLPANVVATQAVVDTPPAAVASTIQAKPSIAAKPSNSWLRKNAGEFAAVAIFLLVIAGANGKLGNVFGGVSQAFSSDTSHVFSATSKTDGQFNADIDVSKKTGADIQAFISMGGMMQTQSRFRDAESAYFVAAKIAQNLHGAESVEYAKAIDGLAFMYFGVCTEAYVAKKNSRSSEERNACETADRQFQQIIGIYDKKHGVSSQEANAARDSYASMLEILDKQNEAAQVRKQMVNNPAPVQQPSVAAPTDIPTTGNLPAFSENEGYAAVRQKMLLAGWQPFHAPDADVCSAGEARCQGRPEMEACQGGGSAGCRFLWQKDGRTLAIVTVGEDTVFNSIEAVNGGTK